VDHGEGVEDDDRERIFEPFWRKSETTPGAGLGLAIAREIVEAHGGRIVVAPTPGGGATFRLALAPRREQSARGPVGSRQSS
jgi:two-component system OmpR family sensor kinase